MRRTVQSCSRKKTDGGCEHQRACQVPVAKAPQALKYIVQVVIVDIGGRRVQSIRRAGSQVVDCFGALTAGPADG